MRLNFSKKLFGGMQFWTEQQTTIRQNKRFKYSEKEKWKDIDLLLHKYIIFCFIIWHYLIQSSNQTVIIVKIIRQYRFYCRLQSCPEYH